MSQSRQDTNIVFLSGFFENDPQHRELPTGLPVANVKLVVVSRFLSTDKIQAVSAINLTFYGPAVEWAKPLRSGDRVSIQGEIVVRSTSITTKSTTTEIVVRTLDRIMPEHNLDDPTNW